MRLVKYRKDGKLVYYSLDDDHVERLFHEGLAHVKEKPGPSSRNKPIK
jgi:ArsR family transcriptional regulator